MQHFLILGTDRRGLPAPLKPGLGLEGPEESLRLPAHWGPPVGKWQDQYTLTLWDDSRGEGGAKEGEAGYTKGTPWGQGP